MTSARIGRGNPFEGMTVSSSGKKSGASGCRGGTDVSCAGERGSAISQRTVIGSFLVVAALVAVAPMLILSRKPVLGVPLSRAPMKAPAAASGLEADRQPGAHVCGSTAFIDYTPAVRGLATPRAAVRSYRPDSGELRIRTLEPNRAIVEELRGGRRVATYEVFRTQSGGWLVGRADTFAPCGPVS